MSSRLLKRFTKSDSSLIPARISQISSADVSGSNPESPFGAGDRPQSLAYSPDGLFLAVANEGDDTISIFAVNLLTGVLSEIGGSPFSAGDKPSSVAYSPNGLFLANANENSGDVSVFSV